MDDDFLMKRGERITQIRSKYVNILMVQKAMEYYLRKLQELPINCTICYTNRLLSL